MDQNQHDSAYTQNERVPIVSASRGSADIKIGNNFPRISLWREIEFLTLDKFTINCSNVYLFLIKNLYFFWINPLIRVVTPFKNPLAICSYHDIIAQKQYVIYSTTALNLNKLIGKNISKGFNYQHFGTKVYQFRYCTTLGNNISIIEIEEFISRSLLHTVDKILSDLYLSAQDYYTLVY